MSLVVFMPNTTTNHGITYTCNWIGEHEITKLKNIFASNPEKKTQKQAQKDINEME